VKSFCILEEQPENVGNLDGSLSCMLKHQLLMQKSVPTK
jgi:hypothetical protein